MSDLKNTILRVDNFRNRMEKIFSDFFPNRICLFSNAILALVLSSSDTEPKSAHLFKKKNYPIVILTVGHFGAQW